MGGEGKTSFRNLKMKYESECEAIIYFSFFLKIVKVDVCEIFLKKSGKTPEYGEKKANKRCLQGSVGTGDEKVMKK